VIFFVSVPFCGAGVAMLGGAVAGLLELVTGRKEPPFLQFWVPGWYA
jgi:hypothetical protein